MTPPWHISVLIPARNEERLLARCLRSVLVARSRLPSTVTCDLIVAVDSSTDRTWEVAHKITGSAGLVICTEAAAVGPTRALAAEAALHRHTGCLTTSWLANTDADCVVPESWLNDHLALAHSAEAAAGIVDVDNFDDHDAGVARRFQETYLLHQDGSHPHVHGANFGVRADAYRRAGGWGNLATGEDHDLWERLNLVGAKRISTTRLRVVTSGRRVGRAPCGFSHALAAHNETAA